MNPLEIIDKYYPSASRVRNILISHSRSVADKALAIAKLHPEMKLDLVFIQEAAMLHDIGIFLCNAPGIDCHGDAPYICHGYLGADLMRKEGYPRHALVCERHTGMGLSPELIRRRNLPLPNREMRPQSSEELLICFADKFFSKTRLDVEKSVEKIRQGLAVYGNDDVSRFDDLYKLFLGK